jgi:energy-coupling factor transporter ATP-binding protein EcfA2
LKLTNFSVENFRSVASSGNIPVEELTALVGRNESGKSNLLLALETVNPIGGQKDLDPVKNFPRGRHLNECHPKTVVVNTVWQLDAAQIQELSKVLPDHAPVKQVHINRKYHAKQSSVDLVGVKPPVLDPKKVTSLVRRLMPVIDGAVSNIPEPHLGPAKAAIGAVTDAVNKQDDARAWGQAVVQTCITLRGAIGAGGVTLDETPDALLAELEELATKLSTFEEAQGKAKALVLGWVPTFIYIADFPELSGHQNLAEYVKRRDENQPETEAEKNFARLAKVAGFDPKEINALQSDHEKRQTLLSRASALITQEMRRLWKDRRLTVRFSADGPHLDTMVYDENADYPVEVNLDERSRGFRWFFSFYVTFSADTQGGAASNAVLLLDEPGLYLHARSQEDLLSHFRYDYKNQIVYTTHSPFMIPPDTIEIVRTVNISDKGTEVTKDPSGDARTLFPLQAALGYNLSQTLFVGTANLVVEGVTDFWILSSVNDYLRDSGKAPMVEKMVLTPAGGAGKVSYMTSLLASQELDVIVLLDDDKAGHDQRDELVKSKILREASLLFTSAAFATPPAEADIEDIIDPTVYDELVKRTFAEELKGKPLNLNAKIPRIVKRYEEAFQAAGINFFKSRPAREFMVQMGKDPSKVLTAPSIERFERLIKEVNSRYEKHKAAGRKPFQ